LKTEQHESVFKSYFDTDIPLVADNLDHWSRNAHEGEGYGSLAEEVKYIFARQ
jgi:hypothetical protein